MCESQDGLGDGSVGSCAEFAGEGMWRERRCPCVDLGLRVDRWAQAGEIERWRGEGGALSRGDWFQ